MFQFLDTDASLYNYAKISVNNEYFGVYLALEAVEDSFMLRNYGTEKGYLYKPDSMNRGNNNDNKKSDNNFQASPGGEFKIRENFENSGKNRSQMQNFEANTQNNTDQKLSKIPSQQSNQKNSPNQDKRNFASGERIGRGGFPGGMGGGGNLNYSDDNLDSYSTIWNGEVVDSTKSDHKRVVEALKNVHERTDIERYIDVDQVLKYMAVHNFSVNKDSLSGSMAHNYYLYEANGQISILPWDYNLAFGGMNGGDATRRFGKNKFSDNN